MDLISVIVPVYNVEKYLDACVESIVNQTYTNLEIILVDDGSPDRCPEMCDTWAQKDSRIKVIHKENGGLSDARNAGMNMATGDYIGFIDSDDIIRYDMFEILHKLITEHNADHAQGGLYKYETLPFKGFPNEESPSVVCMNNFEAVKSLMSETNGVGTTCCNTLTDLNIAKSVAFEVGKINEDVLWIYRILARSSEIVTTSESLYAYYQRTGSIMNSSYTKKRFDALYSLEQRAKEIKTDFPELYPIALRAYAGGCFYHYQFICRLPKTKEYKLFKSEIHKRFCNIDLKIVIETLKLKYKLWYWLFKHFPDLTCKVRNLLKIGL